MKRLGLERTMVDRGVYEHAVKRFRDAGIVMPTFAELAEPTQIPAQTRAAVAGVDPDEPHPLDRKSTRLNSSHIQKSRMPSSA